MSGLWVGPLLLAALSIGWFAVQRAWLACMERPAESDALARPGQCGGACACKGDAAPGAPCPRRRAASSKRSLKEIAP